MKTLYYYLLASVSVLFVSCEGDQGPPGPPGLDGGLIVSSAFEIVIDFNSGNNYERIEPYGFNVEPFDVTLVYILWETDSGQDIWRLLPQRAEFNDGFLEYNFDFTQTDVRIFLDGTTDFNNLGSEWTTSQVFRVVVIPADDVDSIDISNIKTVMKVGQIQEFVKH